MIICNIKWGVNWKMSFVDMYILVFLYYICKILNRNVMKYNY